MNYLYIDFETTMTKTVSLGKMTLRKYLASCNIICVGWAINDEVVQAARFATPEFDAFCAFANAKASDPDWCLVAHNASFDIRVLTQKLEFPWPKHIDCTLELAQAWTPCQPGGYSLSNLSKMWNLLYQKSEINFFSCSQEELLQYCSQDVRACRELHKEAMLRLHPKEIALQRLTQQQKEISFSLIPADVLAAVDGFAMVAQDEAVKAADLLGSDDAFGDEGGIVKSVKPHEVKRLLLDNLGFDVGKSISVKKIDVEKLRQSPAAAAVLRHAGEANRSLSHKRRVSAFINALRVDCELTYYAAHTGRWSSRNGGKGLNLHNLPKRNPVLAKLIRQLFRLDDDMCFVRADLSNVEYRVEGWLTDCEATKRQFTQNLFSDPYSIFWHLATGYMPDLATAIGKACRQLAKNCVLGLGFLMGLMRWMNELMVAMSDPRNGLTLEMLSAVCEQNRWFPERITKYAKAAQTKLRAPWQVAVIAQETHRIFHEIHPEFSRLAHWLERATHELAQSAFPDRALDRLYALPIAPRREKLELSVDDSIQGRSVRVRLGHWPTPTILWRDLATRDTPFGPHLTCAMGGNKGWRALTKNILIENVTQSCARCALGEAMLQLEPEYPYQLSVHDEELLVVPRNKEEVEKAKRALCRVLGPGNSLGYEWAITIKPSDVSISKTMYEDEQWTKTIWQRLENNDLTVFAELP